MAKKQQHGLTDAEFAALVDRGFEPPQTAKTPKRKGGMQPWIPPDSVMREVERDGATEGLTKGAARMNGLLQRCFGVKGARPLKPDTVEFLNKFDEAMREVAHANGIELREDDE